LAPQPGELFRKPRQHESCRTGSDHDDGLLL
jgi:hypothetical protein